MIKKRKTIKRRKQGKTDYKARFSFLKSGINRLVVRKTNRYVIAQIVSTDIAQDKVLVGASSKDLLKYGWPKEASGSLKSLGAAYLTGRLLAKKGKNIEKRAILDSGLQRNKKQGRIYSVLKGLLDEGFEIPHGEESLPSEDLLNSNEKIAKILNRVREKLENE